MSFLALENQTLSAQAVFDVEDVFARERGVSGPHPRAVRPLRFVAVARIVAGAREQLDPPPVLEIRRNTSGYDLFFGTCRVGDDIRRRLADGTYAVRVESDGVYQRLEHDVSIPRPTPPYVYDLEPGFAYPFPSGSPIRRSLGPTLLRGSLQGADTRGIAGATVEVVGASNAYRTDETGQWVLVFPDTQPSGDVTVRFTLPDGTVTDVPNVPIVAGREATLAQTALRGSVMSDAGAPIADAEVAVSGQPATTRTGPDGSWFYFFPVGQAAVNVDVTATVPDGASQLRPGVPVQPRATVVVPSFRFA